MTPNHIEVLIHCHVSATAHPRMTASAVLSAHSDLLAAGLIAPTGVCHGTTSRGVAHLRQLCALAFPKEVSRWVGADGKEIDVNYPKE